MAKETKEQRALRQAADEAESVRKNAEFRAGLPKLLMEMVAIAADISVPYTIELCETGPKVTFTFTTKGDSWKQATEYQETITYASESWLINHTHSHLLTLKGERDAYRARGKLAQEVFDRLTPEERKAVKEHAPYLQG